MPFKDQESRRIFLKKFTILGGVAAAGSMPASAAIEWLRTEGPSGGGSKLQLDPDPGDREFSPHEDLLIFSKEPGSILVFDGQNREYFKQEVKGAVKLTIGGALGNQPEILYDKKGRPADFSTFRVNCKTGVDDY